jgi:hypothetical protein
MTGSKAYQKCHAKARQRRRLHAQERLERDRRQAQQAAKVVEQALHDLGLPDNLALQRVFPPIQSVSCHPVFAQKYWDSKLRKKLCKALQHWLGKRMKGVKLQRNHLAPAKGNLAWDCQKVLHNS